MTSSILSTIRECVETEADKYCEKGMVGDWSMRGNYIVGAESMYPLIELLIKQRNEYPESNYPHHMCNDSIKKDNEELINLLKAQYEK